MRPGRYCKNKEVKRSSAATEQQKNIEKMDSRKVLAISVDTAPAYPQLGLVMTGCSVGFYLQPTEAPSRKPQLYLRAPIKQRFGPVERWAGGVPSETTNASV